MAQTTSIIRMKYSNLKSLVGDTITEIDENMLRGITKIRNSMFYGCTRLSSVKLPTSITQIDNRAFANCISLISINLPDSLERIDGAAFTNCTELENITIPPNAKVGAYIFQGCSKLSNVTISNGVTELGESSFSMCSSLPSITLPNSITKIGNYLFSNCTNLSNVIVEAVTPPTIGYNVFSNTHSSLVIQVPSESVNTYKSATGWSTYADKIQAIPIE